MDLPLFTKEVWYLCTLVDGSSSCNDAPNLRYLTERKAIKDCTFFATYRFSYGKMWFLFQNNARISNYDIFDFWELVACSQIATICFNYIDSCCKLCKIANFESNIQKSSFDLLLFIDNWWFFMTCLWLFVVICCKAYCIVSNYMIF